MAALSNRGEPAIFWSRRHGRRLFFYGPCLKKVLPEHRILSNFGGSFQALDPENLFCQWKRWLGNLEGLGKSGEAAHRALNSFKGVVGRQVELILESLAKAD